MKSTSSKSKRAILFLCSIWMAFALQAEEPQVIETIFSNRPEVKVEVERIFALPSDLSGIEDLSMSNPESESVLVLVSFGSAVTFIATIYEFDDDEVVADTDIWISSEEKPPYIVGTAEVILDEPKENELENIFSTAEIEYKVDYIINYNSENEVAAYDKILRARIPKSDPPEGSDIVMTILDDVFEYDWQFDVTKSVIVAPED